MPVGSPRSPVTAARPATRPKVVAKMAENVRKSIEILRERSKQRPLQLFTPAMLRRHIIPYNELAFQYVLGSIGLRYPSTVEIIAEEKTGSTTFVMDWIGRLVDFGCYSVYIECEGKMMDDKRIKRLMDRDPDRATEKMNAVAWAAARSLSELEYCMRQEAAELRKRCDKVPETKGNPIFVFVDYVGALMSKGEAKGNTDWGQPANAKKETPKDTSEGKIMEHANHLTGVTRWLPSFLTKYNCMVVFVSKQSDKVETSKKPGKPSFSFDDPSKNDTRIGGRSLKRVCAYRFTLTKLGDLQAKDGFREVYGHNIRIKGLPSSYGPPYRYCDATIYYDRLADRPGFRAPGFSYDDRTAMWLATRKFLGITVDNGLYTCDLVGCVAVTAGELMDALRAHPEHLEYVGAQLGIEGFAKPVEHVEPAVIDEDQPEEEEAPVVPFD